MFLAYLNGRYTDYDHALVHIEDRGYQFADGIYEVIAMKRRHWIDMNKHMSRLMRSLNELGIPIPMSERAMQQVFEELRERWPHADGALYVQITRGVSSPRNHIWKTDSIPTFSAYFVRAKWTTNEDKQKGVKVITAPEIRWGRRDIKTIGLLPNSMAKNKSAKEGAREAILVDDGGYVTEASVSNFFIVNANGEIITHPADNLILGGVTRDSVIELARSAQLKVVERRFTINEVMKAPEAFLTGTSLGVLPVIQVNNDKVGNGGVGEVSRKLIELYDSYEQQRSA
jgi:D-alanine transaminase